MKMLLTSDVPFVSIRKTKEAQIVGASSSWYFRIGYASDEDLERAMSTLGHVLRDFGCGQS